MLHDPPLLDAVESLEIKGGWSGMAWRQTIGTRDPFIPNSRGARWNPPELDALYCALTSTGAEDEVKHLLSRQPVRSSRALTMTPLKVRIGRVADIRGLGALADLGISMEALTSEEWHTCQKLGSASAWLGFGGILVPSARHQDGNLVVFVNNLLPTDVLEAAN